MDTSILEIMPRKMEEKKIVFVRVDEPSEGAECKDQRG